MRKQYIKNKVLVLNASYEPLNVCNWKRAVLLLFKGKAEKIEDNGKVVHTSFKQPTVIRLRQYIKMPHKEIPLTRRNLMYRDQYTCQYCQRKEELTIDHVLPRSRGGIDSWENVVACCQRCNVKKGNMTPKEAKMELSKQPKAPLGYSYFEITRLAIHNFPNWKKYIIGLSA